MGDIYCSLHTDELITIELVNLQQILYLFN
jgi:hypothetical protein